MIGKEVELELLPLQQPPFHGITGGRGAPRREEEDDEEEEEEETNDGRPLVSRPYPLSGWDGPTSEGLRSAEIRGPISILRVHRPIIGPDHNC